MRIQNPYLLKDNKPVMPYNRVFIQLEGLLYGEFTETDGEYIKGHRPVLNGKQMYSRVLIRRKQFEIVKFRKGDDDKDLTVNGKTKYFRIQIRRKQL